jgi:hypothetical protein
MKRRRPLLLLLALGVGLALVSSAVSAQSGGYQLDWWTADGGGGALSGTGYTLSGTAGQADAGTLSGGDYKLTGGFWGEALASIYLPLILR